MQLRALGIERSYPAVVVLGAGASRGASCIDPAGVLPPLDADFFVQAQRLAPGKLLKRDRELLNFIRSEFGPGDLPTLEVFFTQVAAVDRFHREFNTRGRVSGKFARHLNALRQLIPRVLHDALGGRDCLWHQRIAAALRTGDSVLSFNYDTVIDRALRSVGGKRWAPETAYGFRVTSGVALWAPPPSPGPAVKHPVLLLKPHGSLNWHIDSDSSTVELVDEYTPPTANSIVPPTWDKSDVTLWPWHDVWRSARSALGGARILVVIGYSVPTTDQLSQALLRADVNRLQALIVVNPDPASRRRVIELMSSAMMTSTRTIELETLEEFASYLPPLQSEPDTPDVLKLIKALGDRLDSVTQRIEELRETQSAVASEQDELRELIRDARDELENLELPGFDTLSEELQRLQSDVADLDGRIDSIVL